MTRLLCTLLFFFAMQGLSAQEGHRIEVQIDGYEPSELYLGYHYGDKQYLLDTAQLENGQFVFAGEAPLKGGVYLIVMAPDNNFFQVLVTEEEQHFSLKTQADSPTAKLKASNAPDNTLFNTYMQFLEQQKPKAEQIAKSLEAASTDAEKEALREQREAVDAEVRSYQQNLLDKHPNTLTAAIVRANIPLDMPEFEGSEEAQQRKRWRYTQHHYFDNLDLADPRMLRSPFLFQRVDYFVNKLQVQHPDTIAKAIDFVLERMKPAEETFKFYLIHFLNEAARSKIVGMDALYVHIAEKYYATGLAPWTEEEQLAKIINNAKDLKPTLIGKIAPDIALQKRDGSPISLHEVESPYTVLYFWRHDCGHCKKSTPDMKAFYEKYKDKGVQLVAVCAKFSDEIEKCWEYVDENEIGDWLHLVDTYHRSRYMTVYNIKSTPQLFILGPDKEILSKRIGAEQLEEVLDRIIEMRSAEKEDR